MSFALLTKVLNTTSGNNVLTGLSGNTDTFVGAVITGTGIQAGTVVSSFNATTVTMSATATATNTGITATFSVAVQTGTDNGLGGLNGLTGVTRNQRGDGFDYWMPTIHLLVRGTLTVANQQQEHYTSARLHIDTTGIYSSGTFCGDGVTPKYGSEHFSTVGGFDSNYTDVLDEAGLAVAALGSITLIGGSITLRAGVKYNPGAVVREYSVLTCASRNNGAGSLRFRANSANVIKRNCVHYDCAYDLFSMPTEFSVKGVQCEYVSQYVGGAYGGVDAQFTTSALSNPDGLYDFDNYAFGWVEIYNCAKGAALAVACQSGSANHCVPLYQNLNFTVTNLSGVAQNAVKFTCTDAPTNSPTVTFTTAGALKTWDFRNLITYTGITSGGGLVTSIPVLKVWHGSSNTQNLRFPSSTATYRFCGYNVLQQDISIVLGSDTAQAVSVAMQAASFLTLTEAQANALTGITLVAAGASGGTVTLTSAHTDVELWQYFRAWKPSNLASNDNWTFDGVTLNIGSWSLAGLEFLTGGITASTASAGAALTNVNIIGNVTQTTPTNLTNVKITGTLSYNTASTLSITYTNSNIGTVLNSGAGIITITPSVTCVVGNYSNVQINYLDSTLTLLNATSATVYSSASNRDSNISPGSTITTPLLFKYGSTVSGIPMTGTVYFRVTSGTTIMLSSLTLSLGANVLDLGTAGQIALLPTITAANVWSVTSASYSTSGTFGYDSNVSNAITSLLPGTGNY